MLNIVVFYDLETGGLEFTSPIIQIAAAAVDLKDFTCHEEFEVKIRFDLENATDEALNANSYDGIVWAEEAIPVSRALQKYSIFLNRWKTITKVSKRNKQYKVARVGGHNIKGFDDHIIQRVFQEHKMFYPVDHRTELDTQQGAAWYFQKNHNLPQPENFKLTGLCEHFGINTDNAHDAMADVRMSYKLAKALLTA